MGNVRNCKNQTVQLRISVNIISITCYSKSTIFREDGGRLNNNEKPCQKLKPSIFLEEIVLQKKTIWLPKIAELSCHILFLALICGGELKTYYFITLRKMSYWRKKGKKYASELERKVSIYKRKKIKDFAQGSKKCLAYFFFIT